MKKDMEQDPSRMGKRGVGGGGRGGGGGGGGGGGRVELDRDAVWEGE